MPNTFEVVRERLLEVGDQGVNQTDLHRALREQNIGSGTYESFRRYFWYLVRLGWVERIERTEPASLRTNAPSDVLSPRTFYVLTRAGRDAPPDLWGNPQRVLYPSYAEPGRWRQWYTPTGRPRGRPRRRPVTPPPGAVVIPEMPPTVVPSGRLRRLLRTSEQARFALRTLLPQVNRLEREMDAALLEDLVVALRDIGDMVEDGLDTARGAERDALVSLQQRLLQAEEGIVVMEGAIPRQDWEAWGRGLAVLRQCCEGV
ncbi:MAG: hypothetical protein Q8R28_15230 [Dehalococcoidia bacterium]|nr:hypothetical protein [Dehalococcoidia bacterium]